MQPEKLFLFLILMQTSPQVHTYDKQRAVIQTNKITYVEFIVYWYARLVNKNILPLFITADVLIRRGKDVR